MKRLLFLLALPVLALGCDKNPTETPSPAPVGEETKTDISPPRTATKAGADGLFICHHGPDCGKAEVKKGDRIPGCCGKEMVKASTYTCGVCGNSKVTSDVAETPKHCGQEMNKLNP